jgi:serine/threonine protein kinase
MSAPTSSDDTRPLPPDPRPTVPPDAGPTRSGDEPPSVSDSIPRADTTLSLLAPPQGPGELGRLAHYRVLDVLGRGGMGVVYRAEDVRLHRPVALKVLQPILGADAGARERFLREARALAALRDDHVVTVYDVGEDRGLPYLATELLAGVPLSRWLAERPRPPVPHPAHGRHHVRGPGARGCHGHGRPRRPAGAGPVPAARPGVGGAGAGATPGGAGFWAQYDARK